MRSTPLTACLLMQTAVLATVYTNTFLQQTDYNGQNVELFQPFALCGMLVKLDIVENSVTNVDLNDTHCTIGCVNKTSDAFRIGIYACDGGMANFALPISFTDMHFTVQHSDAKFIAQGQMPAQQLYLQLVPNLSCLQYGQNTICVRVTKYEQMIEPWVLQKEHQAIGTLDIGINRSIWTKASMNGDANVRSMTAAVLITNSLMLALFLA